MPELLSGDLDRVSLASILQLVELEGHHGPVRIPSGQLDFIDGSLVRARFLSLTGRDAAVESLVRARGRFVVDEQMEEIDGEAMPLQHLILDSCRILDDLQRFGTLVPERPNRTPDQPVLVRLLQPVQAGSEVTFAALLAQTGVCAVEGVDVIVDAVESGVVRVKSSTRSDDLRLLDVREASAVEPIEQTRPASAPPVPPADRAARTVDPVVEMSFDDLVFSARRCVRERRYADAEAALERALSIRPDSRIAQQNLKRVRTLGQRA